MVQLLALLPADMAPYRRCLSPATQKEYNRTDNLIKISSLTRKKVS